MTHTSMRLLFGAAALALGACGSGRSEASGPTETAPAATANAARSAAAAAAPATPAAIPVRFLGVWDSETGSCEPESELRLRIAADGIGFIESHGTLTHMTERQDGAALIGLAMEGEGEQWEMSMTLSLTGQGADERLVVPFENNAGEPVPLQLKRCPA